MSREGYHPRIREVGQRCQSRKAGGVSEGVDAVSEIAGPQRDEVAKTAAKAAASLGIDPG